MNLKSMEKRRQIVGRILRMKPGRKMDRLVASCVMGLCTDDPRPYSTNIVCAWDVLEKFNRTPDGECDWTIFSVACRIIDGKKVWRATIETHSKHAETAPLAICRTALAFIAVIPDWFQTSNFKAHDAR